MKFLLLGAGLLASLSAREVFPLHDDWKFMQGEGEGLSEPGFDDSNWQRVTVPHDWSIAGEFREDAPTGGAGGWLPSGVAWYRREVEVDRQGATWLEFDGVMARAEVWWNGEKVGERPYGYSSFRCDLTGKVQQESNTLVVKADTSAQPASRWYTGAGIYRKVRLVTTDALHVEPDSLFVTTPEVSDQRSLVRAELSLSRTLQKDEKVSALIVSGAGEEVAAGDFVAGQIELNLSDPQLWEVDDPQLYHFVARILRAEEVVDEVSVRFGVRRAEFRSETGFWLNERNLKLKGVCLHHDGGAVGAAVPLAVWEHRLNKLRELGVNAIRTAHNPVDPGFLDLCDEMGFLVMNEAFDCWLRGKKTHDYHRYFADWWERDLRTMVRRDRNHPSVILYSVGNEIRDTHEAEKAQQILTGLVSVCHEEDPTRPVTQALFRPNTTHDYDNGLADKLDVIGTNYRDEELLEAWHDQEGRKIVGTEQGHNRSTWFACRDNPQHAGQFLWCGIDYLGESRTWPVTTFNGGLLDRTGVVNPRGWERQSWWSDEPMVKVFRRIAATEATPEDPGYEVVEWKRRQVLFPDWNAEGEQNVEVYSNADEVELFLNGKSLGSKRVKKDFAVNWNVPFEPGSLLAVARREGEEVARDAIYTAGPAARLELIADRKSVGRGFDDLAFLRVRVVDDNGVLVPKADQEVTYQIRGAGELVAVDSGSITSHERFQVNQRRVFQGKGLALVRGKGEGDEIRVTASAKGLEDAILRLHVR